MNTDKISSDEGGLDDDSRRLRAAREKGAPARLGTYVRLSGPGWLQSALTLGAGSLTGSLYLGVLAGFSMLWLQPIALILGISMLSAIGYVTISTDQRPFLAINEHINPALGWGWALASLAASIVWAMPQYALANGVLQQNLIPGFLGPGSALGEFNSKLIISITVLAIATTITWNYGRGGLSVRIYEFTLKILVAIIVVCFMGVVIRLGFATQDLQWGEVLKGFIPNPALLIRPADGFQPLLEAVPEISRAYWHDLIVAKQQDVMAAAVSSAVGINMTFLFGYSILRRGWGPEFSGLMKFDLVTGMLIPFILATSCIMIASATQFHTISQPGLLENSDNRAFGEPAARQVAEYERLLTDLIAFQTGQAAQGPAGPEVAQETSGLGQEDRRMAATLVTRDAFDLANALRPFTGDFFSRVIFGIGVLAMALSSITLMMVISGFVICEMLNLPHTGWPFRFGSLAAATGVLGPFFWDQAYFWLAVPTSIFGLTLLPIAYMTFFLMMNQRSLLGQYMPTGRGRITWNVLMGLALVIIGSASVYMIASKAGAWGLAAILLFLATVVLVHLGKRRTRKRTSEVQAR